MLVGIRPEISESIKDIYTAAKVCASECAFLSSDNIPVEAPKFSFLGQG
jgi:hypothetical protein